MTEPRWLDAEEQRTWRAFLWATQLQREALERQLQRDARLPLAYYQILAMLSEAPGRSLTMTELAARVWSSQSRLSHAAARLEEAGWIRRDRHPTDGRTTVATLTDVGFDVLVRAAPGHAAEVRRTMFDRLSRDQVRQLHGICQAMLDLLADGCDDTSVAPRRTPLDGVLDA